MSLPEPWVERIFDKLNLTYGHQFLSRWDGLDMERVKADWGHELRGFQQNPGAITYALEHLPADRPPTVLQFRALCNSPQSPQPERPIALPRYVPTDQDEGSRTVARIKHVRAAMPHLPKGVVWAFALEIKDREDPRKVTATVRAMYRHVVDTYRRQHPEAQPVAPSEEPTPWQ